MPEGRNISAFTAYALCLKTFYRLCAAHMCLLRPRCTCDGNGDATTFLACIDEANVNAPEIKNVHFSDTIAGWNAGQNGENSL